MGLLSDLFSKFSKKTEQSEEVEKIQEPVVEAPRELTQEEKDDAFLWAICDRDQEKALAMLAAGANPNYERRDTGSAVLRIGYAFSDRRGNFDPEVVLKAAIKAGLDFNAQNRDGLTAIASIAYDLSNTAVVEQFMELGHGLIDYNAPVENGQTTGEFIEEQLYRRHFGPTRYDAMKELGDKKREDEYVASNLDEISAMVKTWKMLQAVKRGDQKEALKMIEEGANLNMDTRYTRNGTLVEQLAKAIENPKEGFDPKVVFEAAMKKGLDLNTPGYEGRTAITDMVEKGISYKGLKGFVEMAKEHIDMKTPDYKGQSVESCLKAKEQNFAAAMANRYGNKTY